MNHLDIMKTLESKLDNSDCLKKQVASCVIDAGGNIFYGYNSTPRNLDPCKKCGRKQSSPGADYYLCRCLHAEINAIMDWKRRKYYDAHKPKLECGVVKLLTTTFPCNSCALYIIKSGISEVYYRNTHHKDSVKDLSIKKKMEEAGITVLKI